MKAQAKEEVLYKLEQVSRILFDELGGQDSLNYRHTIDTLMDELKMLGYA